MKILHKEQIGDIVINYTKKDFKKMRSDLQKCYNEFIKIYNKFENILFSDMSDAMKVEEMKKVYGIMQEFDCADNYGSF